MDLNCLVHVGKCHYYVLGKFYAVAFVWYVSVVDMILSFEVCDYFRLSQHNISFMSEFTSFSVWNDTCSMKSDRCTLVFSPLKDRIDPCVVWWAGYEVLSFFFFNIYRVDMAQNMLIVFQTLPLQMVLYIGGKGHVIVVNHCNAPTWKLGVGTLVTYSCWNMLSF